MMLSHVQIGVSEFDRAFAFYTGVMEKLGFVLKVAHPEQFWAAWVEPGAARPLFIIGRPFNGQAANPGNGNMTALLAASRSLVDQCYVWMMQNGATDEGAPGLRPHYHPDYYGAYVRDTEGNKLCICCHTPEPE